jgi:hypothetical protein
MDCADCGAPTRVTRTTRVLKMTARVIECACGARFETLEKIAGRLPSAAPKLTGSSAYVHTGSSLIPTGDHRRLPAIAGEQGSLSLAVAGGKGGLISLSESGSGPSDPDLDPILVVTPIRGRAREQLEPRGFGEFWAPYPRKVAKAKALAAWIKINPSEDLIRIIAAAILWQRDVFLARDPELRPHPATWLNQRRWEDEKPEQARGETLVIEYTEDFETLWTATGRHGHKEPAARAYAAAGSPDPARAAIAWTAYLASLEEWRSPKDLSSWLGINGHLQQYGPPPAPRQMKTAALRTEEDRTARAAAARIESLRDRGMVKSKDAAPPAPDHIRDLADGKSAR